MVSFLHFFYFIPQRKALHRISKEFDICMSIFGFVNAFNILAHIGLYQLISVDQFDSHEFKLYEVSVFGICLWLLGFR